MWYAAHVIMAFKHRTAPQSEFPFWENIVLIQADNSDDAWEIAERLGREDDAHDDTSLTWNGIPTRLTFVGVRKIIECRAGIESEGDDNVLATGTEVSYSLMSVKSEEALQRLVEGESVAVEYEE
jgi:hypothetical protein